MKNTHLFLKVIAILLGVVLILQNVGISAKADEQHTSNSTVNQTHIDSPIINTIYDGDTTITGTLPGEGITDEGVTIPISGYTSAASFSLNGNTYVNDSTNQMFNYTVAKLSNGSYSFSFTLPSGMSFKTGDKLNWFIIPADIPTDAPQLSQKLSSEVTVVNRDKTSLIVRDSELTVGDDWKAEDNFVSATDYYGNSVSFSDISVSGDVNTDKVGTYKVTYTRFVPNFFSASENQGTYSAIATIKVNAPAPTPTQGGDVTVKYEDTEGNIISDEVVKTGNVGENYTTEQKDIEGYTFKEVKGDSAGVFTDQPQTVTYVYIKNSEPVAGADVTAKYVDTDGNKISDEVVMSGNIGENYGTEQKTISGYTFKEVQGSATGVFTDQPQTVTYVYTKSPVKIATVTVKYVDTDGNKISEDVVKTGNIGENYSTEQKDIEGYTFKEVKGTATGIYTGEAQVVTYVYTKDKGDTTGISKVDNAPTSESNIKNSKTVSTDKHVLPETSENGRITLLTVIIGFILLSVGVSIAMFRRSKIYK